MSFPHQKLSFLSLALPRPNVTLSPSTALQNIPPSSPGRQYTSSRPRHSSDSWNSVEDESTHDWTPNQLAVLAVSLDFAPSHLGSPYAGAIPPSNLLDAICRNILDSRPREEWPHSLRSTRLKLLQLAKQQAQASRSQRRESYRTSSPSAALGNPHSPYRSATKSSRVPLYRQNSMDFLPIPEESTSITTRDSSLLQRSERVIAHAPFHPYERPPRHQTKSSSPSSLSPSPPSRTRNSRRSSEARTPSPIRLGQRSGTFHDPDTKTPISSLRRSSRHRLAPAKTPSLLLANTPVRSYLSPSPQNSPHRNTAQSAQPKATKRILRNRSGITDENKEMQNGPGGGRPLQPLDDSYSFSLHSHSKLSQVNNSRPSTPLSFVSAMSTDDERDRGLGRSPRLRRVRAASFFRSDENLSGSPFSSPRRMIGRKISFGSDHGARVSASGSPYAGVGTLAAPFEAIPRPMRM